MSIDPGVPYRIINAQSGLALHLLDTNNRSIIGNLVDNNDNRQVWIPSFTLQGLTFASAETGQSIGFPGGLKDGVNLVVGDPNIVKAWLLELVGVELSELKFKILLHGSNFAITLPSGNPQPGTPVSLSADAGTDNQIWIFTKTGADPE